MKNTEKGYAGIFSTFKEIEHLLYAIDSEMPDMYDHNFTYIRKGILSEQEILSLCKNALNDNSKKFYKVVFEDSYTQAEVQSFIDALTKETSYEIDIENYGRYVLVEGRQNNWTTRTDCEVHILTNQKQIEDLVQADIAVDGKRLSVGFCTRRANSLYNRIMDNPNTAVVLLYRDQTLLGSVVVYVLDHVCKIEEFSILPDYQRKGFGTTLLKAAVQKAYDLGAETIFADTDEDDTAKDMYMKLGFIKHSENHCIFMES